MTRQFFIIGPLRTGSSLMARCIDDHPECICLCESEINRALFKPYFTRLHAKRMESHGFSPSDVLAGLDGKKQDSIASLMSWYHHVRPQMASRLHKKAELPMGDKSPDFFESPAILEHLAAHFPLIYTVRDPRAIFHSIGAQADSTPKEKMGRWKNLASNYAAWKHFLDQNNVLVVRFEDLVADPEAMMARVYSHLALPYSNRFMDPFVRRHPRRFLWKTAIDWTTGVKRDFDTTRIHDWREKLTSDELAFIAASTEIADFMQRFCYD